MFGKIVRPPLILCSGSLGDAPLDEKFRAAAAAGFDWVSVYGHEYHAAVAAGIDPAALRRELGLQVAEVDGVVTSLRSSEAFDEALAIARALDARSITIVETGEYDPADEASVVEAAATFGACCDLAAHDDILVHLEPFSWSELGRTVDAAAIAERAGRTNGGVLLDYWHHVRGPDQGLLDPTIEVSTILGIQLADTLSVPWDDVRDECMTQRQLPGEGHADLAQRLASLAKRGPLPPIGIEVFGDRLAGHSLENAARLAFDALVETLAAAGI